MKFTKFILAIIALSALIFVAPSAVAQKAGLQVLLSGGTTTMLTGTTNQYIIGGVTNQLGSPISDAPTSTNLVQSVGEYNTVGLTWKFVYPTGSTNGAVTLKVYKTFDNGTVYESNPTYTYTFTPGAGTGGTWKTNASITTTDVTHLAFSMENQAVDFVTNILLEVNLKAVRTVTKPATN